MCAATYRVHGLAGYSGGPTGVFVRVKIGHVLEKRSPRRACLLPHVVAMQACPHIPPSFILPTPLPDPHLDQLFIPQSKGIGLQQSAEWIIVGRRTVNSEY